jgi:uncharacterized protein (TIGR00369 family)
MDVEQVLERMKSSDRHYGLDFTIVERGADRTVCLMPVTEKMLNPAGTVNAGAMIWLADVAATLLAFEYMNRGPGAKVFPVLVDLHTVMLGNVREGEIAAEARPVRHGRRVSVVRTRITAPGEKLLAEITSTHIPN